MNLYPYLTIQSRGDAITTLPGQTVAPLSTPLEAPTLPVPNSPNSTVAYYAIEPAIEAMADRLEEGYHYRIGGRFCDTLDQLISALLEVTL